MTAVLESRLSPIWLSVGGTLTLLDMTGANCAASSTYASAYTCHKAFDGQTGTLWGTVHENVGAWIEITFPGGTARPVGQISVENRRGSGEMAYIDIFFAFGEPF